MIGMYYAPVLECSQQAFHLSGLEIPAHRVFDLELLLLLIQLAADDLLVDSIDDEVFELANRRYLEVLEEVRVGQDLGTMIRSDGVGEWVEGGRTRRSIAKEMRERCLSFVICAGDRGGRWSLCSVVRELRDQMGC